MAIINVKLIAGTFTIVSLLLLVSLAQEMNRRIQIQREVRALETRAQDLERSVIELANLNQYFRTDAYQERLAREKLNYRAPGEQVVLIPENAQPATQAEEVAKAAEKSSPLEEWWKIFFVPEQEQNASP